MKKDGQLFGQIFTYIVAIVIVGFLLLFGYNAIFTFKDKADQVALIQFKNDLQKTIETISLDFGSVKIKQFIVPEGIKQVCFVENFPALPTLTGIGYPLIENSINDGVKQNVFLLNQDGVEEELESGPISTPIDFFCVPVIGSEISLRLEGKGDHADVSLAS